MKRGEWRLRTAEPTTPPSGGVAELALSEQPGEKEDGGRDTSFVTGEVPTTAAVGGTNGVHASHGSGLAGAD